MRLVIKEYGQASENFLVEVDNLVHQVQEEAFRSFVKSSQAKPSTPRKPQGLTTVEKLQDSTSNSACKATNNEVGRYMTTNRTAPDVHPVAAIHNQNASSNPSLTLQQRNQSERPHERWNQEPQTTLPTSSVGGVVSLGSKNPFNRQQTSSLNIAATNIARKEAPRAYNDLNYHYSETASSFAVSSSDLYEVPAMSGDGSTSIHSLHPSNPFASQQPWSNDGTLMWWNGSSHENNYSN
jgi:hypothetical protein